MWSRNLSVGRMYWDTKYSRTQVLMGMDILGHSIGITRILGHTCRCLTHPAKRRLTHTSVKQMSKRGLIGAVGPPEFVFSLKWIK